GPPAPGTRAVRRSDPSLGLRRRGQPAGGYGDGRGGHALERPAPDPGPDGAGTGAGAIGPSRGLFQPIPDPPLGPDGSRGAGVAQRQTQLVDVNLDRVGRHLLAESVERLLDKALGDEVAAPLDQEAQDAQLLARKMHRSAGDRRLDGLAIDREVAE